MGHWYHKVGRVSSINREDTGRAGFAVGPQWAKLPLNVFVVFVTAVPVLDALAFRPSSENLFFIGCYYVWAYSQGLALQFLPIKRRHEDVGLWTVPVQGPAPRTEFHPSTQAQFATSIQPSSTIQTRPP